MDLEGRYESVSRLGVGRYRGRMFLRLKEYVGEKSESFVFAKALLLQVTIDRNRMRLYREDNRSAGDIYAHALVSRDFDGGTCDVIHEMRTPPGSKTASVAAAIRIKEYRLG